MRRGRMLLVGLGMLVYLLPWGAGGAALAAEPAATTIDVTVMPYLDQRGNEILGQYWLLATLTSSSGQPIADREVAFREPVEFFGSREAKLGTAVTDYSGLAAIMYQPAEQGEHKLVARFAGDQQYGASAGELAFDFPAAVDPFPEESLPLADVGMWLSVFLGLLGVVFWAVLLVVLSRTVLGIRRAASVPATARSQRQEVHTAKQT